jgi:hypothetical protein
MSKFSKHKWWIVTALLTVPLVAIAAVPNVFTANTVISSAQVNANFAALDTRLALLEAATAKSSATVVMNQVPGSLGATGKTATFTTSGQNPLLILVSGTAYTASTATPMLDIAVQLDGQVIGHMVVYTNEASSHKTLPTRAFTVPAPPAGSHTLGMLFGNASTISDANDFYNATVIELH